MVSKSIARSAHISPRKARVVVELIKGRNAGQAIQLLDFTHKASTIIVKKLIEDAIANARIKNPDLNIEQLFIESAYVDKASNSNMRRWRPRAMGRATRIQKGVSHITVELNKRTNK